MTMRAMVSISILLLASSALTAEKDPLREKAASSGKDPDAQLALGYLYIEAMQLKKAKLAFKQAKWRDMNSPEARLGLIRVEIAEQNFRPAKGACRKLERSHTKSSAGAICSGHFWLANRRPSRAAEEFEKAISLGDTARGKLGLGDSARLQASWDASIQAYREALEAGAGYEAHMGLGLALERKGDEAGALAELKKAVALEPASCLAHFYYGTLLKEGEAAKTELETALAIRPGWFDAQLELGAVYARSKNHQAAAEAYRAAVKIDGKRAEAYMGLGKALYELGKLDEALAALKRLAELVPNTVDAYLLTAEIQFSKSNVDAAIEALDRARGVASSDVSVFIRAAEIYVHAKRYTNASVYLNQAISMKPRLSKAHAMLGEIACSRKLYDEGRKHYARALKGDLDGVSKDDLKQRLDACKK
jgi:tetratricopeptide (TPR) repeat protein